MAIIYTETDTTASPVCISSTVTKVASDGGTAGSTELTFDIGTSQGAKTLQFQMTLDGDEDGASGTWVCRYNVTTAEMNSSITEIQGTHRGAPVGCSAKSSFTTDTTGWSLGTTGTVTVNFAGPTLSSVAAGDVVEIRVVMSSTSHSATIGITPSLNIDSPLSVPGSATFVGWVGAGVW